MYARSIRGSVMLALSTAIFLSSTRGFAQDAPLTEPQPGQTVTTPPMDAPEPPDASIRRHDGFYLRLGIGIGVVGGTYEPDEGGDKADVSGGGGASEIALGGTLGSGFVLGGGIWGMGTLATTYETDAGTADAKALNLGMLGPFIDFYFDERSGGHLTFAIGFAGVQQAEGEDLPDGAQFAGGGFGALVGGGYEWWVGEQWSIGVIARVQYASVATKTEELEIEGTMSLLSPAILFGVTYH